MPNSYGAELSFQVTFLLVLKPSLLDAYPSPSSSQSSVFASEDFRVQNLQVSGLQAGPPASLARHRGPASTDSEALRFRVPGPWARRVPAGTHQAPGPGLPWLPGSRGPEPRPVSSGPGSPPGQAPGLTTRFQSQSRMSTKFRKRKKESALEWSNCKLKSSKTN